MKAFLFRKKENKIGQTELTIFEEQKDFIMEGETEELQKNGSAFR